MSESSPPPFLNASNCTKCSTSFGFLTRKHHCRACGGTYCDSCSKQTLALPEYGLMDPVRVCDACIIKRTSKSKEKKSSITDTHKSTSSASNSSAPSATTTTAAVLAAPSSSSPSSTSSARPAHCKCSMPLCICPPLAAAAQPAESKKALAASPAPAKQQRPTPASTQTTIFSGGLSNSGSSTRAIDLNGDLNEQCREAVKAGDANAVHRLLEAGAKANYIDKTGNSLLHLAAIFNYNSISIELLERGADMNVKNPAGESPLDVAPPSLQHKFKNFHETR